MADFWKILRILTTNQCNYRCIYCHNEGQEKNACTEILSMDEFINIAKIIDGMGFREVRFSGGEPLVNPNTIDMIEWLDKNSEYEIGLATNGSLINEEITRRLGNTRVMVTLHFPAVDPSEYERVTGKRNGDFFEAINLLEKYNVNYSFNFVLYPETVNNIESVVSYVIREGKRIKLLPFIERDFNNISENIINRLTNKLDTLVAEKCVYEAEGLVTWKFKNGGKVKLLESPCYRRNINTCKEYGELRLLPDMSFQKCIFDTKTVSIRDMSNQEIRNLITSLWQSFSRCL